MDEQTVTAAIQVSVPAVHRSRWAVAAAALVLIAAGIAVYWNSFHGPFIFDDDSAITGNADIRALSDLRAVFFGRANALRPVVSLTFALNYGVGKLDPFGYHVVNLLIHILAGLTLFGLCRRTLEAHATCRGCEGGGTPAIPQREAHATIIAALVALLWLIHPLQTASVTYVVQRAEALMALFYLLTLYCFMRGCEKNTSGGWWVLAVIAAALGMGSKQVMVTAPLLVLLYDRTFISGSFRAAWRRHWRVLTALAATTLIVPALLWAAPAPARGVGADAGLSAWEYVRTESGVLLHYMQLCLLPYDQCMDYLWPVAKEIRDYALPGMVVVVLLAVTGWALVRRPALGFLGAWFFLILAPTSSFLPLADPAFEHRLYLPLAAVLLGAVLSARAGMDWCRSRLLMPPARVCLLAGVFVAGVALGWGALTVLRNSVLSDEIALWRQTVQMSPHNYRAWNRLGNACYAKGQLYPALSSFEASLDANGHQRMAWYNRALTLERLGKNEEALASYDKALEVAPDYEDAVVNRGLLRAQLGRLPEALADLTYALTLRRAPDTHYWRGKVYQQMEDFSAACADYTSAIEANATFGAAYRERAACERRLNQDAAAERDAQRAAELRQQPQMNADER